MADTAFLVERSPALDGVLHGFFGSSKGAHQFGFGGPGEVEQIRALRGAAADILVSGAPLQAPHQVHSADVVTLEDGASRTWPDNATDRPPADAVVTNRRDIVIGIVTADCGPVLLADKETGIVGAAHAGWRGAHGGVLENTVVAMEALGAKRDRIIAVLGPTIAQRSYEVDEGFRSNFVPSDEAFFEDAGVRNGANRWHFDLPGYILARLESMGVGEVAALGQDTYAKREKYYSYRRAMHEGSPTYGRQLSVIAAG